MRDVPLVVIANKQDNKDALPSESLAEKLDLLEWPKDSYYIIPCCALNGDGLADAFKVLAKLIRKQDAIREIEASI